MLNRRVIPTWTKASKLVGPVQSGASAIRVTSGLSLRKYYDWRREPVVAFGILVASTDSLIV